MNISLFQNILKWAHRWTLTEHQIKRENVGEPDFLTSAAITLSMSILHIKLVIWAIQTSQLDLWNLWPVKWFIKIKKVAANSRGILDTFADRLQLQQSWDDFHIFLTISKAAPSVNLQEEEKRASLPSMIDSLLITIRSPPPSPLWNIKGRQTLMR